MLGWATSQSKTLTLEANKLRLLSHEYGTTTGSPMSSVKFKPTVHPLFYIIPYATDVGTASRLRGTYCMLPLICNLKTKPRNKHPKVSRAMNVTTAIQSYIT